MEKGTSFPTDKGTSFPTDKSTSLLMEKGTLLSIACENYRFQDPVGFL